MWLGFYDLSYRGLYVSRHGCCGPNDPVYNICQANGCANLAGLQGEGVSDPGDEQPTGLDPAREARIRENLEWRDRYLSDHNSNEDFLLAALDACRAERDALSAALGKINDIRNSIIATQSVNWSEHIYPLVAVLN